MLTQAVFPHNFPPRLAHFPRLLKRKAKISIHALTHTHDHNRSTSINFVHLYIIHRRLVVVEGGNDVSRVKRNGKIFQGLRAFFLIATNDALFKQIIADPNHVHIPTRFRHMLRSLQVFNTHSI